MRKIALILTLLAFSNTTVLAQGEKATTRIGARTYPGYLIAHRADASNLETHIYGVEVYTEFERFNHPELSQFNRLKTGITGLFMDLGNPELSGKVYGIVPYFELGLTSPDRPTQIRFRMGSGLGYITRKFDIRGNRKNMVIGSHINGAMQLYFFAERQFGKIDVDAGIGLTHFSNASFRVPNLGINMPSLYLGLGYSIDRKNKQFKALHVASSQSYYEVSALYGFKERTVSRPVNFHIKNIQIKRIIPSSSSRKWRLGVDIASDPTYTYDEIKAEYLDNPPLSRTLEVGLSGGAEWTLGNMALLADLGFYVYQAENKKYLPYQRLGFRYNVNKHCFIQTTLRVSFGIADYMEWGVGYRVFK